MRKAIRGFTVIEIMIVVSIIGILASIGFVSYGTVQRSAQDKQRVASATIIAEAIEKIYDKTGSYPGCSEIDDLEKAKTVLGINDDDVLFAPKADRDKPPIACVTPTDGNNNVFVYLVDEDGNGTWELKYLAKDGGFSEKIENRRTPATIAWDTPSAKATSKSSSEIILSWSKIPYADIYISQNRKGIDCDDEYTNGPKLNGNGTQIINGLEAGTKYCYKVKGSKDTRYSPFSEPAAVITAPNRPTISVSVAAGKLMNTLSATCVDGLEKKYKVSTKINSGNWSEFTSWSTQTYVDTGISPTPGNSYFFKAIARCIDVNHGIESADSDESSVESYSAAAPTYSLTVVAYPSSAGTTTGAGSYKKGDSVTISANPGSAYTFDKWEGNSVCGVNFNMPSEDVTCKAIFKPIAPPLKVEYSKAGDNVSYTLTANCINHTPIYRYQWRAEYLDTTYYNTNTGMFRPRDNNTEWEWDDETENNSVNKTTYEGMYNTLYAQAKCRIKDRGDGTKIDGPWSDTKQGYWARPVAEPTSPAWSIHSYDNNRSYVHIHADGSTCSTGMKLYRRYDINSITHNWYEESTKGWYRNVSGGTWASGSDNAFIESSNNLHIISQRKSNSTGLPLDQGIDTKYQVELEQICINPLSEIQSGVLSIKSSEMKITKYE